MGISECNLGYDSSPIIFNAIGTKEAYPDYFT